MKKIGFLIFLFSISINLFEFNAYCDEATELKVPQMYGQAYHEKELRNAETIHVSIKKNCFMPGDYGQGYKFFGRSPGKSASLTNKRPSEIINEPKYSGSSQRYGYLKLGTKKDNKFYFVFDLITGPNPILYFDKNQNRDLSDDGGPIKNQGTGVFSSSIAIPYRNVISKVGWDGFIDMWLFAIWEESGVAHYNRNTLKGRVKIDNRVYDAYISDSKENDADYTNDGVYIDIDKDGKINRSTEFFSSTKIANIRGGKYTFAVSWDEEKFTSGIKGWEDKNFCSQEDLMIEDYYSYLSCDLSIDHRDVSIIEDAYGGCKVLYTKFNERKIVAESQRNINFCESKLKNIRANLERAGFVCE